jgi:putative sigma-54 modulation protein
MQIKVTGRGTEITPAIRDYALDKASKLEEFFSNIQKVEVVIEAHAIDDVEKRQMAEIRAWMAGKKVIQAKEAGRDAYAALDLVIQEAKRQIEKHKEKHVKERRRKGSKEKRARRETTFEAPENDTALVKLSRFVRKIMTLKEAQEELKVMGQDFLAFRNADNNEVNVIRNNKGKVEILRAEKEMSTDDAVAELQSSGSNLIIFNNASTRTPSIIFKRKSGNFGLIEPEI